MSVSNEELANKHVQRWIGRKWSATVSPDSLSKVEELLSDDPEIFSRQHQINQQIEDGENVLVLFSTVQLNGKGYRVAIGKDLSSLTRLQQRLISVQQSMERDYLQLRQCETRYRLLFETVGDAIIIAEADSFKVIEANPSACTLLETAERKIVGSSLLRWFDVDAVSYTHLTLPTKA